MERCPAGTYLLCEFISLGQVNNKSGQPVHPTFHKCSLKIYNGHVVWMIKTQALTQGLTVYRQLQYSAEGFARGCKMDRIQSLEMTVLAETPTLPLTSCATLGK